MNGTDLESSGRWASLTWSPPVACEWLWTGNDKSQKKYTKSFAQVNVEVAISHLMKKCELKPVGSGTATAAFGEVAT